QKVRRKPDEDVRRVEELEQRAVLASARVRVGVQTPWRPERAQPVRPAQDRRVLDAARSEDGDPDSLEQCRVNRRIGEVNDALPALEAERPVHDLLGEPVPVRGPAHRALAGGSTAAARCTKIARTPGPYHPGGSAARVGDVDGPSIRPHEWIATGRLLPGPSAAPRPGARPHTSEIMYPVGMPPRSLRTATLTFGLVNIPVRFFTATSSQSPHFHMVHESCGSRIKQQLFCPKCERVVERAELVRGYELHHESAQDGQFVLFTEEELRALETAASPALD